MVSRASAEARGARRTVGRREGGEKRIATRARWRAAAVREREGWERRGEVRSRLCLIAASRRRYIGADNGREARGRYMPRNDTSVLPLTQRRWPPPASETFVAVRAASHLPLYKVSFFLSRRSVTLATTLFASSSPFNLTPPLLPPASTLARMVEKVWITYNQVGGTRHCWHVTQPALFSPSPGA